jgi:hypothetical protein
MLVMLCLDICTLVMISFLSLLAVTCIILF